MSVEPSHETPVDAVPWAMQLAARVERTEPPTADELCAAGALAVIGLLEDEQAQTTWAEPLEQWQGAGRIRKLVRRARASAWERVQLLDGCTAQVGTAEVRAFVPSPMDRVPGELAKLQIKSTELGRSVPRDSVPTAGGGLTIVVTPEVEMTWGKEVAQCAHAAQLWWRQADDAALLQWQEARRRIDIVHAASELWPKAVAVSEVQVRDGGFTEIPAGTMTTVAFLSVDIPPE